MTHEEIIRETLLLIATLLAVELVRGQDPVLKAIARLQAEHEKLKTHA